MQPRRRFSVSSDPSAGPSSEQGLLLLQDDARTDDAQAVRVS